MGKNYITALKNKYLKLNHLELAVEINSHREELYGIVYAANTDDQFKLFLNKKMEELADFVDLYKKKDESYIYAPPPMSPWNAELALNSINQIKCNTTDYEEITEIATVNNRKTDQDNNKQKIPEIIQELIDTLQLEPEPIGGKYQPTKNDRKFVFWIVDNKYDDYLTQDNYFNFIRCNLEENTIKRYFQEAKDERDR